MTTHRPPRDSLFSTGKDDRTEAHGRADFSPAYRADSPAQVKAEAREMTASGDRGRMCRAVLDALRDGPKTGDELVAITHRFGARIKDLRDAGHRILTTSLGGRRWLYTLTAERAAP